MSTPQKLRRLGKSVARSNALGSLSGAVTKKQFRIVSYHGVPDAEVFAKHVDYYAAKWTPVSGEQVLGSLTGGEELPADAVWVTFDDGESSVVRNAMGSLVAAGIPATLYVCPGLVAENKPYWWRVIDEGIAQRSLPADLSGKENPVRYLKTVGDAPRRKAVEATWALFDVATKKSLLDEVASLDELRQWQDNGLEIGNHSWDHPLLDQLDYEMQVEQVRQADEWLRANGFSVNNFAYPNGNFVGADGSADAIRELGYSLGVLHDHQLTSRVSNPLQLSRLKTESDDPIDRLNSIVSGFQPLAKSAVAFIKRSGGS